MEKKKFRALERIMRGASNHRRIEILELLAEEPRLSVFDIAIEVDINYKTAGVHVARLTFAGLISKKSAGRKVEHTVTEQGEVMLTFLRTLAKGA
jgi:predicted transcriptional regulator